jgi:hypothetical protein
MRAAPLPNPRDPINVAHTAQQMAQRAGQDRMAFAFQVVALGSMLLMGTASAVQLLKEMRPRRGPPAPDHDLKASVAQLLKELQRRNPDRGR